MDEIANLVTVDGIVILLLPFFSGMLYDFFQPGMVFGRYGEWLFKDEKWWKKPLGACLKCFHIWVCIGYILALGTLDIKNILYISISYFILTTCYYK